MTQQTCTGISVLARDFDYTLQSEQEVLRLNMGFTVSTALNVPLTPTLVPRPGITSPSPLSENACFSLENVKPDSKPISFSVKFPAGQVPSAVFLGWTTPSFWYIPSQFASKEEDEEEENKRADAEGKIHSHDRGVGCYGQCLEAYSHSAQGSTEVEGGLKTAFMVCLCDLLPVHSAQLVSPVK